jgi:hypothetical protein
MSLRAYNIGGQPNVPVILSVRYALSDVVSPLRDAKSHVVSPTPETETRNAGSRELDTTQFCIHTYFGLYEGVLLIEGSTKHLIHTYLR